MSKKNIVECIILLILFITGLITKRMTKERVKELDGFSLIYRKGDCPGTIVAGIDESDRLESRKQHKEPFWSWIGILFVSGLVGIGVYTQVVAQEVLSVDLSLKGTVQVSGDTWDGALSEFSFRLADDGSSAKETVIRPDKEGNIYLGSYTYYKEGTYTFQIRQEGGSIEGMMYDVKDITVTVIIAEKNGRLESEVKIRKGSSSVGEISFTNTYKAPERVPEETERQTEQKPDEPVRETKSPSSDGKLVLSKTEATEVETDPEDEKPEIREYCYTICLENPGDAPVYGVYVRDYMPAYTVYAYHTVNGLPEGAGAYGAIEGKEHVTIFLDELEAGGTAEVQITIRLRACLTDEDVIESQTRYEVLGEGNTVYTNEQTDPAYVYHPEDNET